MTRRPRSLSPDERELWRKVAATARALHPDRPERTERHEKVPPKKPANPLPVFRVGEKAPVQPSGHDPAPSPGERLAAEPLRMDRKTYERMRRGYLAPEARLDLHGMTVGEAHAELIRFVLNAQSQGLRLILVITGKGRGEEHWPRPSRALRHQVPHWLALPPLGSAVQQVAAASRRHGGEGAYYIYLRRR